jgi:hypothetical protein
MTDFQLRASTVIRPGILANTQGAASQDTSGYPFTCVTKVSTPRDYDWQLRAICANGELSTELMTDSQPTGNFAGLFSTVCR